MTVLSVITVTRDDPAGMARTATSLGGAGSIEFEWIVVDSTEAESLRMHTRELASKADRLIYQKAGGVYRAMNCGVREASGEYVIFINGGDEIESIDTLNLAHSFLKAKRPLWMTARVKLVPNSGKERLSKKIDYQRMVAQHFALGRFPLHPGTIFRRSALLNLEGFNVRYSIAADYEAILKFSLSGPPLVIQEALTRHYLDGLSSQQWLRSIWETHQVRSRVFGYSTGRRTLDLIPTSVVAARGAASRLIDLV